MAPRMTHPGDISYELGSTGHNITWKPREGNPANFTIYQDSSIVDSGPWDGASISIDVDSLGISLHNYTAVVNDTIGNWASDTVWVTVSLGIPTIDHPADLSYEVATTGHTITWTPSDSNPHKHVLYRNGTLIDSKDWIGGAITTTVDGLSPGSYNYTLVVNDTIGNWVSDTVWVFVSVTNDPPSLVILVPSAGETYQGLVSIQWEINDPEGDLVNITLFYWDGSSWVFLLETTNAQATSYDWDTTQIPNGSYRIKILVSDGVNEKTVTVDQFIIDNEKSKETKGKSSEKTEPETIGNRMGGLILLLGLVALAGRRSLTKKRN